jgi:hypothetical protein
MPSERMNFAGWVYDCMNAGGSRGKLERLPSDNVTQHFQRVIGYLLALTLAALIFRVTVQNIAEVLVIKHFLNFFTHYWRFTHETLY